MIIRTWVMLTVAGKGGAGSVRGGIAHGLSYSQGIRIGQSQRNAALLPLIKIRASGILSTGAI